MTDEIPAPRSDAKAQRWQTNDSGASEARRRRARRRTTLIVLAGLFLLLGSLAVVWFLMLQPRPETPLFLSINIGDYDARSYPIVAFVHQDRDRIARHFLGDKQTRQAETKTKEILQKALRGLADSTKPMVIHITALALVRNDKIYLLPGDANPDDETTWLEVADLIDSIAKCRAEHKLLILDLAHPLAEPRLGVLADRVAEELEKYLKKNPPPFYVLCPCSAGQYSLASEVMNSSVLAFYLDQGLQGQADANDDHFLTVKELFAFTAGRVDRWAKDNRATRQTPLLLGNGVDFCIVNLWDTSVADNPKVVPAPLPASVMDGWKKRDQLWDQGALRIAPRRLRELELHLVRLEKRLRGGGLAKADMDALNGKTSDLVREISQAIAVQGVPPRSLALRVAQANGNGDEALVNSLTETLALVKPAGAKKEFLGKIREDLIKSLVEPKKATASPERLLSLFKALSKQALLIPEQILVVQAVLTSLKPAPEGAEVRSMERLVNLAERYIENFPADPVVRYLHVVRSKEAVLARLDREPLYLAWIAPAFEKAESLRRSGEKKLFWGRPSGWTEADQDLRLANEQYGAALTSLEILERCRNHLDQAFAELPLYSQGLCSWPELDSLGEQSYAKAAKEAYRLQIFFATPPGKEAVPIPDDRGLVDLARSIRKRIDAARVGATANSARRALLLLQNPLLKFKDRSLLDARERKLATELDQVTQKQDDSPSKVVPPAPGATGPSARDLARTRARMSLEFLRLGGIEPKANQVLIPPGDRALSDGELALLERTLQELWRTALTRKLPSQTAPAWEDARDRVVAAVEPERRAGGVMPVSQRLRQRNQLEFARWLEKQYQSEGNFLQTSPRLSQDEPVARFYVEAARELRSMIRERE